MYIYPFIFFPCFYGLQGFKELPHTKRKCNKKKAKKKNKKRSTANYSTEPEPDEASNDTHFDYDIAKLVSDSVSDATKCESNWQQFWNERGEFLVWQGWLNKYPDYIDPLVEGIIPMPAIEEVEVTTTILSEDDNGYCSKVHDCSDVSIDKITQDVIQCSVSDDSSGEELIRTSEEGTDTIGCGESFSGAMHQTSTVNVNLMYPTQTTNEAISHVMMGVQEEVTPADINNDEADSENRINVENERNASLVSMMHDYAFVRPSGESDSAVDIHPNFNNPVIDVEDEPLSCNEQWAALWEEHYQEIYWYYYSQYHPSQPKTVEISDNTDVKPFVTDSDIAVEVCEKNVTKCTNEHLIEDHIYSERQNSNTESNLVCDESCSHSSSCYHDSPQVHSAAGGESQNSGNVSHTENEPMKSKNTSGCKESLSDIQTTGYPREGRGDGDEPPDDRPSKIPRR